MSETVKPTEFTESGTINRNNKWKWKGIKTQNEKGRKKAATHKRNDLHGDVDCTQHRREFIIINNISVGDGDEAVE